MELIVNAYKTDDILLKLSIVEAIPKFGDSEWNANYVKDQLVTKQLIKECFVRTSYVYFFARIFICKIAILI